MRIASALGWLAGLSVAACVSLGAAAAPKFTVLYGFCAKDADCTDGIRPMGALTRDASGYLYGAAQVGGARNNEKCQTQGCGVVFQFSPATRSYRVLHKFCVKKKCAQGAYPEGHLLLDTAGNLYGMTLAGGRRDEGIVFKLTPGGKLTVLHEFCAKRDCADGAAPTSLTYRGAESGAPYDGISPLYGTAGTGPQLGGVIFKLDPRGEKNWKYKILYAFCGGFGTICTGGSEPYDLTFDPAGKLIGTTSTGTGIAGAGTIFRFDGNTVETLHNFCALVACADGKRPGAFVTDGAGNLYGSTAEGGAGDSGVIYRFSPDGKYKTLHDFCALGDESCRTGTYATGTMALDAQGNLFGTAGYGPQVFGTIFRLTPGGHYQVVHGFCAKEPTDPCREGANPDSLIADGQGHLFGVAHSEGPGHYGQGDGGVIFEFDPRTAK